jgi:hypothetical protein
MVAGQWREKGQGRAGEREHARAVLWNLGQWGEVLLFGEKKLARPRAHGRTSMMIRRSARTRFNTLVIEHRRWTGRRAHGVARESSQKTMRAGPVSFWPVKRISTTGRPAVSSAASG